MKWSDEPLYKRNQAKANEDKFYNGELGATAREPSRLLSWWMQEAPKRAAGQLNEIDIAEIRAVEQGFKNGWSKVKIADPKLLSEFLRALADGEKEKIKTFWSDMVKIKNQNHDELIL